MPKHHYLTLLICLSPLFSWAQIEDGKVIVDGKLKWEDFTGPIDPDSKYEATVYWHVSYKYKVLSIYKDTVTIDLQVIQQLKGTSWVIPTKKSDALLQHEQGHFDLATIGALLFKKKARSATLLKDSYAQTLRSLFSSILSEIRQMELQYDADTNHMLNRQEQNRWNKKLNDLLTDLQKSP